MPKETCKYCHGSGGDVIDESLTARCPDCDGNGRTYWCELCGGEFYRWQMDDENYCWACSRELDAHHASALLTTEPNGRSQDDNDATSEDA